MLDIDERTSDVPNAPPSDLPFSSLRSLKTSGSLQFHDAWTFPPSISIPQDIQAQFWDTQTKEEGSDIDGRTRIKRLEYAFPEFSEIDFSLILSWRGTASRILMERATLEQPRTRPLSASFVHAEGFAGEENNVQLSLYPSERGPFSLMIDHRPREGSEKDWRIGVHKGRPSSQMHTKRRAESIRQNLENAPRDKG